MILDTKYETILSNFSFLTLFLSMIAYWVEAGFSTNLSLKSKKTRDQTNLNDSVFQYIKLSFGTVGILISNISLICLLLFRWYNSGHFPLSNLYESLMFLSWSCTSIHLLLESFTNNRLIGCLTAPTALFTNAFATFSLPPEMQHASPLVPALQSNWLMMHVTVMIFSYSALILGSLLSIAFLIITGGKNILIADGKDTVLEPDLKPIPSYILGGSPASSAGVFLPTAEASASNVPNTLVVASNNKESNLTLAPIQLRSIKLMDSVVAKPQKLIELARTLDNLSYRILGIGFPFLTIGILSGAVWANESWGSYWSWDPKETWALLTWLVFAIYLHTRLTKGWEGTKPAIIASLGFVVVWICFLGVNLIGEGLHSYGWVQPN